MEYAIIQTPESGDELFRQLWQFYMKNLSESKEYEEFKQEQVNLLEHKLFNYKFILAMVESQIVGIIRMNWLTPIHPNYSGREKVTRIALIIDQDHRDRGYAGLLLRELKQHMVPLDLEIVESVVANKEGIDWGKKVGAQIALAQVKYELDLKQAKQSHNLKRLLEKLPQDIHQHYSFEVYAGILPHTIRTEYIHILSILRNDVPRGSLVGNNFSVDEEVFLKQLEEEKSQGKLRLIGVLRNDGEICAITEIVLHESQAHQQITGVLPNFRRKGLSLRIKLHMIDYLLNNFSDIDVIQTDSAPENTAMITTNEKLGFSQNGHYAILMMNIDNIWHKKDLVHIND